MDRIFISTQNPYWVEIEYGLLGHLGEKTASMVDGRKAAIVSDDAVTHLYGNQAMKSLENAGFSVVSFSFPHGEGSKNAATYLELLNFLAENRLTRSDVIIALGGGVVGDLAGFAAATYLRGIPYIQVPTTLLAMVDSSVGGKTAIDLPAGKNLAGAFYQPKYVLCDPQVLSTLPEETYHDGFAEIIKCAILKDPALFSILENGVSKQDLSPLIHRAISIKKDFVCEDERDNGTRQALNLGHTFGHAIEALSGYSLSHGKAVAIGTAMICRAAAIMGYCKKDAVARVEQVLQAYVLPIAISFSPHTILKGVTADKKRRGDTVTLVVPKNIGAYELVPVSVRNLLYWIDAGGIRRCYESFYLPK